MQLLTNSYPDHVNIGNAVYHFKAPFDTVLFVLQVLDDDSMIQEHRIKLCCRMLFGFRLWSRRRRTAALNSFLDVISPESKSSTQHEQVMSFTQDASLIRAAFLQQYGINLDEQRGIMSWFQFCELVSGLTSDTVFGQIVELRSRPIPEPTRHNAQERAQLILAKQRVAIRNKNNKAAMMAQWAAVADTLIAKAGGEADERRKD